MNMRINRLLAALTIAFGFSQAALAASTIIPVTEDVMTCSFFTGADLVRGYGAESNRPTFRVSTDSAFGLNGAESIYLNFGYDFSSYSGPVTATLTMQSVAGGFGSDATENSPFLVSAHGVNANPFTSITDNTNPTGTINWLAFYNNNILAADAAASTIVNGFGTVTFDVSAIVNSWISGTNSNQFIALTGKNDVSGNDFLHGFLNNNNGGTPMGYTFLTVTAAAVPEPESYAMILAGLGLMAARVRRQQKQG
jgi:hypothetical protein